ncbi:MAG: AI-2E family transporter [Candidatus Gracilibacteria bacterium]
MVPKHKGNGVVLKHFPGYFLIGCLIFSFVFLYTVMKPFLTVLILAAIFATTFYPFYKWVLKLFKDRAALASIVTCILILTLIIIPLMVFVVLLAKQAGDMYLFVQHKVASGEFDQYLRWQQGNFFYDFYQSNLTQLNSIVDVNTLDLKKNLTDLARNVSTFLVGQSATLLRGVGGVLFSFFILLFAMYYLLKDHKEITKKLMKISPLPLEYELELFKKFKEMSRATVYGIFLVSILKGILGGIGFLIAGIPNPLFWGTAMAIFSLVPLFGATIIWLPAALLLIFNGQMVMGIFLLLWGTFLVSTIDNFFSAYFIGGQANLNPLLVFLAVFGGIGAFGLLGVIFGPLILTIFFTFLHIYELEYKQILHH